MKTVVGILLLSLVAATGTIAADMEWNAGLATVKITPEKPVPMAGYASRTKPFEKVEQDIMGPWPPLIERPRVEVVNTTRRENITQQQLRMEIALGGEMVDALLLVPEGEAPASKRPAVLVAYYDAETGVGLGAPLRDYGWQLAKRGFVALSIGKPNAHIDLTSTNKPRTEPPTEQANEQVYRFFEWCLGAPK